MERRIILVLLLFILISSNVYATSYGKVGDQINLTKSVRFNGGVINNATCALTLFYKEAVIIPYSNMTYDSSSETFNFTITPSLLFNSGQYPYDITCCANGICETNSDDLQITKTGTESTLPNAFFNFIMLLVALSLFILFMFMFFRIDGKDQYNDYDGLVAINWMKHIKYLMLFLCYYSFIWIMYTSYNIAYGYLDFDYMSKVFYTLYIYPLEFSGYFFIFFILLSIYTGFRDLINMKEIQRFGEA